MASKRRTPRGARSLPPTTRACREILPPTQHQRGLEKALQYFGEAVALDPDYAPAWTGLALAYGSQRVRGLHARNEGYEKARRPWSMPWSSIRNLVRLTRRWHSSAGRTIGTGSERTSLLVARWSSSQATGPRSWAWHRVASGLGRLDEALDLTRRAAMSDPLNVAIHYRLARYAYFLGRLDEAVASFTKVLELNPEYPAAHEDLALVYLAQSRPEAALAEMEQEKADLWRHYGFSLVYYAVGRHAKRPTRRLSEFVKNYQHTAAFQIAEVYAVPGRGRPGLRVAGAGLCAARQRTLTVERPTPLQAARA